MAIGILGAGSAFNSVVTVYTVPAGISHAVVHIYAYFSVNSASATAFANVLINGNTLYQCRAHSTIPNEPPEYSASVMLSPGDVVRVAGATSIGVNVTITGYEVP